MNPLWITYAWADNHDGDFDYLVDQLSSAGVPAVYDRVALVPGQRLWSQIGAKISQDQLSGWAYLLTPKSVASQPCLEELEYAIQRALGKESVGFPLIGLLHNLSFAEVPAPLRARLCVPLSAPDWTEQVRAGVERRPPIVAPRQASPYVVRIHVGYGGNADAFAIEARPRFGELHYWRFGFYMNDVLPFAWGCGPSGGGALNPMRPMEVQGTMLDNSGAQMTFLGSAGPLSPATSAFAIFRKAVPKRFHFGFAKDAAGALFQSQTFYDER